MQEKEKKLSKGEVILEITGGKEINLFKTPDDVIALRKRIEEATDEDFKQFAENQRKSWAAAANTYID